MCLLSRASNSYSYVCKTYIPVHEPNLVVWITITLYNISLLHVNNALLSLTLATTVLPYNSLSDIALFLSFDPFCE